MKRIFAIALALAASLPLQLAAEPPAENSQNTRSEPVRDRRSVNFEECPYSDFAQEDFGACPAAVQRAIKDVEALLAKGSVDEALTRANQLVSSNPGLAMAFATRASCYHSRHRNKEAIDDLDRSVALSPSAPLRFVRASLLCHSGHTADGIRELRSLLNEGDQLPVESRLSMALSNRQERVEAEKYARLAIEHRPLDPAGYTAMSYLRVLTCQADQAFLHAARALELDRSSSQAWCRRAFIRAQMLHDYDAAEADFAEALAHSASAVDRANVYGQMAFVEHSSERYAEAIRQWSKAIEFDPSYLRYLAGRAETYRLMRNPLEARADFSRAIEDCVAGKGQLSPELTLPQLFRSRATINLFLGDQAAYEADRAEADRLENEEANKEAKP